MRDAGACRVMLRHLSELETELERIIINGETRTVGLVFSEPQPNCAETSMDPKPKPVYFLVDFLTRRE